MKDLREILKFLPDFLQLDPGDAAAVAQCQETINNEIRGGVHVEGQHANINFGLQLLVKWSQGAGDQQALLSYLADENSPIS